MFDRSQIILLTSLKSLTFIFNIKQINFNASLVKVLFETYLDLGRNIEPSMNTEPDKRIYQHVDNSPVLKQ